MIMFGRFVAASLFWISFATPALAQSGFDAVELYELAAKGNTLALEMLEHSAENGDVEAQAILGGCYQSGELVGKDFKMAFKWLSVAAEKGHPMAQHSLGYLYLLGHGVPQNVAKAASWWKRSADQGWTSGQLGIGQMSLFGDGVPRDEIAAYVWFNLAAAAGNVKAKQHRDDLESKLSSAQLEEAQRRSTIWRARLEWTPPLKAKSLGEQSELQRERRRRTGDALMSIGAELLKQGNTTAPPTGSPATCGLKALELKPLTIGCRDMVQTCTCKSGSCEWRWTCVP